jgi:hypothetical protein
MKNCPFCNQLCYIDFVLSESKRLQCRPCNAMWHIKSSDQKLIRSEFTKINPDNSKYILIINHSIDNTTLIWYHNSTENFGQVVVKLNFALTNVTAQNLNNKIKTLITYS